jgi:hypothetical protein
LNHGPRGSAMPTHTQALFPSQKRTRVSCPERRVKDIFPSHWDHEYWIKVTRSSTSVVPVKIEIVTVDYHLASCLVLTMVGLGLQTGSAPDGDNYGGDGERRSGCEGRKFVPDSSARTRGPKSPQMCTASPCCSSEEESGGM